MDGMIKASLLSISAVWLLTACHGDSNQAAQPASPKIAPKAADLVKTADELSVGMVEAVTVGKSAVPIAVKFDLASRPTLGQPLQIALAVVPQIAGAARVKVTGSDGLKVAPGSATIDIPSIDPTQAYRINVIATPTADGVQLLDLTVSVTHDSSTDTRSFSIPIIVQVAGDAVSLTKR